MSDEYEVVGYVLKKRESGDGCAGCLGALIVIAILGACIESCVGGKKNPGNATAPAYTEPAPVAGQAGASPVQMPRLMRPGFRSLQRQCALRNGASVAGTVRGRGLRTSGQSARHAMDIER